MPTPPIRRIVAPLLLAAGMPAGAALPHYHATLAPTGDRLAVSVCVDAPVARLRLRAAHPRAVEFLREARSADGAALTPRDGVLDAGDGSRGGCLDYRVDLDALAATRAPGLGWRIADDRIASPRAWLWRPQGLERAPEATLTVTLPAGWSLSAPWTALADDAPTRRRFRLGPTGPDWPALVAFTRHPERRAGATDGRVRLAILGAVDAAQRRRLEGWVATAVGDAARVFPAAFEPAPQVVLVPVAARGADPVPWGQSSRGGGNGLLLLLDAERERADYLGSWTLHHELAHLAHPYLGDRGAWIAEGLATYFQNVLRARGGHIDARTAWRNLEAGFGRGRADRDDFTLGESSARLAQERLYMRVYWSGTALALRADVAWRTRATAPTSLEAALRGFHTCCRQDRPAWRVEDFVDALDRAAGGAPVFGPLLRAHAPRRAFPDVAEAYAALGIVADGGGELRFSAEGAARRVVIMGSD